MRLLLTSLLALGLFAPGCSSDDDFDLSGSLSPVPFDPNGKDDGAGQPSISVDADVSDTEVWKVRNHWEDTTQTVEARAAGLAWPANSGLTWDQKYSAWVAGMKKVPAFADNNSLTYEIVTPYGTTVPSPALECAETAMFLRATFASWYGLPFYMEAQDKLSGRVFFGHFGVRTVAGRWRSSPLYPKYADHTATWKPGQPWPTDSGLQKVHLDGGPIADAEDPQPAIGPDAHLGAYLDRLLLNKRAGYFIAYLLDYFFSGNLADAVNTYNLQPKSLREGDFFLHRTNRSGIGHTLVIKHVEPYKDVQILVELVAGSMPRIQGDWNDPVSSKMEIIDDSGGGVGDSDDTPRVPVWQLGGGLKRWRVARAVGGSWVNTYMPADKSSWISSTDGAQLSARPKFFETYIGDVPAPERRDALVKAIQDARTALSNNPSSCASRADRERAFSQLGGLSTELGTSWLAIQYQYRTLEDAVFATLDYPTSKTCCWDHSSPQMYRIVMDYALEEEATARAAMMCKAPTVFAANSTAPPGYDGVVDGYQVWRDWAAKKGRSAEWIDSDGKPAVWRQDEPCQGAAVKDDAVNNDFDYCDSIKPPPTDDMAPPVDLGGAPVDAPDGGVPIDLGG